MQEEKSYKCGRCGKEFSNAYAMGGHKSHCKMPQPPAVTVSEQPIEEVKAEVAPPVVQIPVEPETLDIDKGEASQKQIQEILEGEWWTIKQLADAVNYSTAWVTRMCQDQRIKAIKPTGGQWRIPKSEVARVMKEGIPPMPRVEKPVEKPTVIEVEEHLVKKVAPKRKTEEEVEEKAKEANPYWPLPFPLKGGK